MRPSLIEPRLRLAPSLLSADFSRLADQVAVIERAGADMLHLDVMDGHFVPNISFGASVIASLRPHTRLFFDSHLMIDEPMRYAEAFAKAGCDLISFHVEVTSDGAASPVRPNEQRNPTETRTLPAARAVVGRIRSLGLAAGIVLNPATPVSAIESVLGDVDLVLVMSVWPGFAGQKFIPEVLDKVRELRRRLRPDQRLEIDGGIDPKTVQAAVSAGADTLVAGSAIFGQPDPAVALAELRRLAMSAGMPRG